MDRLYWSVTPILSGFDVNTNLKGSYLNRLKLPVGIEGVIVMLVAWILMVDTLLVIILLLFNSASTSIIDVPDEVKPISDEKIISKGPLYWIKGVSEEEVVIAFDCSCTLTTSIGIEK